MAGSFGVVTVGEEVGASVEAVVIRLVGVFPRVGAAFLDDGDGDSPSWNHRKRFGSPARLRIGLGFHFGRRRMPFLYPSCFPERRKAFFRRRWTENRGHRSRRCRGFARQIWRAGTCLTSPFLFFVLSTASLECFCFVYSYLHYKNKRALTEWNIYYENVRDFSFLYDALFVFVFDLWEPLRYNTYCQDLKKQRGE